MTLVLLAAPMLSRLPWQKPPPVAAAPPATEFGPMLLSILVCWVLPCVFYVLTTTDRVSLASPANSRRKYAATSFKSGKLGNCHQHVLVFFKGKSPNKAVKGLGLHNAQKPLEWF